MKLSFVCTGHSYKITPCTHLVCSQQGPARFSAAQNCAGFSLKLLCYHFKSWKSSAARKQPHILVLSSGITCSQFLRGAFKMQWV